MERDAKLGGKEAEEKRQVVPEHFVFRLYFIGLLFVRIFY